MLRTTKLMRYKLKCMKKICVYPKDASRILDIGNRKAQRLINKIRVFLNKEKHQYITKKEFSQYTGIPEEDIDL